MRQRDIGEPAKATGAVASTEQQALAEQPFLHDLVSCIQAPTVALSSDDGQVRPGGAQGILCRDRRVLSELNVRIDGREPVGIGHRQTAPDVAHFGAVIRHAGDPGADPTVRLERVRRVRSDGLDERLEIVSAARSPIAVTLTVRASVDLAGIGDVKQGAPSAPLRPEPADRGLMWADALTEVILRASQEPLVNGGELSWPIVLPPRGRWAVDLALDVVEREPQLNTFLAAPGGLGWETVAIEGPRDVARVVQRSVEDLAALTLADPMEPRDRFIAAGSPWFLTLFGRDSLWAARLTLPLGTALARGTLRTLARRQGTHSDPATSEAPGKILHEVRTDAAHAQLPLVYYGSVDATALWVCLLHDAWRWGMAPEDVAQLLEPLEAALGWILGNADADGDGFLEYLDVGGRGLANQGWKDSGDAIQFPDGTIADGPIALSEAQAYAHEAAVSGARLLEAFGRPGADELLAWAADLRDRFRRSFWVSDERGRFPAIALDGAKAAVGTATSNPGHLLGTGLLEPHESAIVAARLAEADLDSGYGLRTMSADASGFNPLGYHTGSVWPHDTAIAVRGLVRTGHANVAASLAGGLLRAAAAFGHHLPELYGGTDARLGEPVVAYPAACRPMAWSAAGAVALMQAALGLEADVPSGVLRVAPLREFAMWFPFRASGLQVGGHPLTVAVSADGEVSVDTTAPIRIEVGHGAAD
ncbi:MAG: glycogen debranching N-terminal domain-containing protein [Chloroflexota bacterium]